MHANYGWVLFTINWHSEFVSFESMKFQAFSRDESFLTNLAANFFGKTIGLLFGVRIDKSEVVIKVDVRWSFICVVKHFSHKSEMWRVNGGDRSRSDGGDNNDVEFMENMALTVELSKKKK